MKVTDANILIYIYIYMNRSTGSLESQNTQIKLHNHTTLHRLALKVKMLC